MNQQQIKYIFLIAFLMLGSTSCASTAYYLQSVNGHIYIHIRKQPIPEVIASEDTDKDLVNEPLPDGPNASIHHVLSAVLLNVILYVLIAAPPEQVLFSPLYIWTVSVRS